METQKISPPIDPAVAAAVTTLQQFRQQLYNFFPHRADALLELLDALASNTHARSVVELSLSPLFHREYSSVYAAIEHLFVPSKPEKATQEQRAYEQTLLRLITPYLPAPQQRQYWLLGTDVTYLPRRFARTLSDRTFVHCPNTIKGNKPITIGHNYSILSLLPEKGSPQSPPWVLPLLVRRVQSTEKASQVGAAQIATVVGDKTLPFQDTLSVLVEDSAYSGREHLGSLVRHKNLVSVIRLPANRVVYRQFETPAGEKSSAGHPTWYGERLGLQDPATGPAPDGTASTTLITKKGQTYTVQLAGWYNMVRTGTRDIPMHKYPFTLVRARVVDAQGRAVFKHAMWLLAIGERRAELSLVAIWEAYGCRYDMEHFYRYGKQRLLWAAFQTPNVAHEENWWRIVQLAYLQLWLARSLAKALPNPWERYLPQSAPGCAAPATVQRDFQRIIGQLGTPAQPPQPRGNAAGRVKGTKPPPRKRQPVIKKS